MKNVGDSSDHTGRTVPGGRLGFCRGMARRVGLFEGGFLLPLLVLLSASLLMTGCVGEDLEYVAPSEPVIDGIPARIDTVGRPVNYVIPVSQSGGTVRRFSITPDLPPGLQLDTVKGVISGTPTTTGPDVTYTIIAIGFGGSDTTTFVLRVAPHVPLIFYPGPFVDTLGRAVSHVVRTNGATVTTYAISPALPSGLQFSAVNGRITGTPLAVSTARSYTVTATGPLGTATAVFVLSVVDGTVVTPPPPPPPPPPGDSAGIEAALTLEYASGIPLAKYVITATSSVLSDAVIRDTVSFSGGHVGTPGVALTVNRSVRLKSSRSYTVQVKTLDDKDSTIHLGSGSVSSLGVNEKRAFPLTLTARYAAYTAKLTLQGNANLYEATLNRPLTFTRATFVVAGVTVFDTTAASGSFSTAAPTLIGTRYVPADKIDQLKIYLYGTATGWSASQPLLTYDMPWLGLSPYAPGTLVYEPLYLPFMTYTGPGSPSDPNQ